MPVFVTWLYGSAVAIDSSLMNCALCSCDCDCDCGAETSVLVSGKVEAVATGLTAGSVSSFSTFCQKTEEM